MSNVTFNTADGEFVLKRTAKAYVVYSIQTGVSVNLSPKMNHAFY